MSVFNKIMIPKGTVNHIVPKFQFNTANDQEPGFKQEVFPSSKEAAISLSFSPPGPTGPPSLAPSVLRDDKANQWPHQE